MRPRSSPRPALRAGALLALLALLLGWTTPPARADAATAEPGVRTERGSQARQAQCTIRGTSGPDRLRGTSGNDVVCGLGGNDVILGSGGREDILLGGAGNDRIEAGTARYTLLDGGGGDDRLVGGTGQDNLQGWAGRDILLGGDGIDALSGGDGADDLNGQGGSDSVRWDLGADVVRGGAGSDTVTFSAAPRRVVVTLDGAANDGTAGEGDTIADDVEVVVGSRYADSLTGNDGANRLVGADGADLVVGGAGNDTLVGDNQSDDLRGGEGDDSLVGGDDRDLLTGGPGADLLNGAGGSTQSPGTNACDDDDADTRRSCTVDTRGPLFDVGVTESRIARGQSTLLDASVDEVAGTTAVRVTTTYDGTPVPWCSGVMDPDFVDTDGTVAYATKTCTAPANAPVGAYEVVVSATDRFGYAGVSSEVRRYGFVVSTTAETTPPVVAGVVVADTTLSPGAPLRVTTSASDPSGITYLYTTVRAAGTDIGTSICSEIFSPRTGGTMADGVWTFDCRLPATVPPGPYVVDVQLGDTYGNTAFVEEAAGFTVAP